MLADAAESASRTISEPTPARIASLVHELAQKRLNDGQFDECGLTLEELKTIYPPLERKSFKFDIVKPVFTIETMRPMFPSVVTKY